MPEKPRQWGDHDEVRESKRRAARTKAKPSESPRGTRKKILTDEGGELEHLFSAGAN